MADIKIIVDSSDVVEASNDVKRLEGSVDSVGRTSKQAGKSISSTTRGMNQFGAVAKHGGKKMNTFNMQLQQGGYQLQDFVVQLQGGTSFFTAFGQQGSQFAGVFGPQGAVIGAVIAIGAAVGGMAYKMLTAGDEVREFQEILEDTSSLLGDLSDANKAAAMSNKELEDSFGTASVQIKSTLALLRSIAENEAQRGIDELASSLTDLYRVAGDGEKRGGIADFFDVNIFMAYGRAAKTARKEARILTAEFLNAQTALSESEGNIEGQIVATQRLLNVAVSLSEVNGSISKEEEALIKNLGESLLRMQETQTVKEKTLKSSKEELKVQKAYELLRKQNEMKSRASGDERIAIEHEVTSARIAAEDDYLKAIEDSHKAGLELSKLNLKSPFDDALPAARLLALQMDTSLSDALSLINLASTKSTVVGSGRGLSAGAGSTSGGRLMMSIGGETSSPYNTGKGKGSSGLSEDAFEKLDKEIERRRELLGMSEAQATVTRGIWELEDSLSKAREKYSDAEKKAIVERNIALRESEKVAEEARSRQESLAETISSSIGTAFTSMVDGTMSVKDAFKSMARDIIKHLWEVIVVQRIVGSAEAGKESGLAGLISKGIGSFGAAEANGGVWQGGSRVQAYANGGVVGGPTTFPMAGGKTGLMGEAGPEAIMPLKRGSNGKLGVQMEGGGGDTIVVNQSFNFQANGDDTVKKLIAQAAPQIAQMTKSSLLNDRRRGGATKATFG